MKNSHQKHLARWIRKGNTSFSRTDFVRGFQEVFEEGFPAHNIILGFEKSGIYPPNPEPAMAYLAKKQLQSKQAELREQQEEVIAEPRQKEERAQVRTARSLVIQEMKKVKEDWRQNKDIAVDGVKKMASWSQWL
ncbi:hypothetical protein CEP51_016905 [Fusarium floridanum]|uniref:Uncharacterized protein n=1 Tax=Fusarium floridanum TaxID=1325733 RepID=A0A428NCP2_9HYPO|nr:hypothetical protein CEP51_016905 [Fusarium floridanum]